jgi:DNA-binding NtrC family response regulator
MTNINKARVLVVDDEEIVRRGFARSLAADYDAWTAADAAEALEEMERRPADVVLLDLRMPGAQGLEVLKAMKQNWPDTEVVIITGYPSVDSAKEAVRLGAGDYLAKPVGPCEIIDVTRNALARKQWALRTQLN